MSIYSRLEDDVRTHGVAAVLDAIACAIEVEAQRVGSSRESRSLEVIAQRIGKINRGLPKSLRDARKEEGAA